MPCRPKRAVVVTICCMSVDMRSAPLGQSPHKAPVMPKYRLWSTGSRGLSAAAPAIANNEESKSRLVSMLQSKRVNTRIVRDHKHLAQRNHGLAEMDPAGDEIAARVKRLARLRVESIEDQVAHGRCPEPGGKRIVVDFVLGSVHERRTLNGLL